MSGNMKNMAGVLLFILSLTMPAAALAQSKNAENYCSDYLLDKVTLGALPRLAALSQGIVNKFCVGELTSARQLSVALLDLLAATDDEFKSIGITENIFPFQSQVTQANKAIMDGNAISNMGKWPNPAQAGIRFYEDIQVKDPDACDTAVKKALDEGRVGTKTCIDLLNSYQVIYSHAQMLVQKLYTVPVEKYLKLAQQQWDDFFNKSRSQTSLELALNSFLWQKDKVAGQFLPPPKMQWILLHPSIVVENVSEALDGSKTQEGVMVEIGGANWWERDKWYQLSGGSIVSLFSDRANTTDWGYGIALHFGNNLTIGAVNHGGPKGYFVSLDVLALYKDKRLMLDSFIGSLSK